MWSAVPHQHRSLSPAEQAIIVRLLSVEFPEVEYFRAQVPHIAVTGRCACGCGTIDFEVDPSRASRAPSKAWDDNPGPIVQGDRRSWLMLFQCDGWLTELEHVPGSGARPQDLDAERIQPDLQVDDDWFSGVG